MRPWPILILGSAFFMFGCGFALGRILVELR